MRVASGAVGFITCWGRRYDSERLASARLGVRPILTQPYAAPTPKHTVQVTDTAEVRVVAGVRSLARPGAGQGQWVINQSTMLIPTA